jgi:hypothetical protein
VYGGAKLLARAPTASSDWLTGLTTVTLLPIPPLVFWVYILMVWHRTLCADGHGRLQRSSSSLVRIYGSGAPEDTSAAAVNPRHLSGTPTLALIGDVLDNPTLIIRDTTPGEEIYEQVLQDDDDNSDDGGPIQLPVAELAVGRPWRARNSGAGMCIVSFTLAPLVCDMVPAALFN